MGDDGRVCNFSFKNGRCDRCSFLKKRVGVFVGLKICSECGRWAGGELFDSLVQFVVAVFEIPVKSPAEHDD